MSGLNIKIDVGGKIMNFIEIQITDYMGHKMYLEGINTTNYMIILLIT